MDLGTAAIRTMGESASDGISPYVWGPALVNAADQIDRLTALRERVAAIADDFYPYNADEAECALREMRAALEAALEDAKPA